MIILNLKITPEDREWRGSERLLDETAEHIRMAYREALKTNRQATFRIVVEVDE